MKNRHWKNFIVLGGLFGALSACSNIVGIVAKTKEDGSRGAPAFSAGAFQKNALILNLNANLWVAEMVKVFGPQNPSWKNELGFTVTISPLQDSDERIFNQLSEAFSLAKQNDYRLLVHVNNEWLFNDCAYCSENEAKYANDMVEKITGVKVLTDKTPRQYRRVSSTPEQLGNVEWTSWDTPQDVHMLAWGDPPTAMPPRLNFASKTVRELMRARSVVVKEALKKCFETYFPQTDRLFEGIDLGWETGIEDQDAKVTLGFGALKTLGYSAASNLSSEKINEILFQVAKDLVDHQSFIYSDLVDKQKLFSHYAVYNKGFTSGLPYDRSTRNPDHMAKYQPLVPGFSIYLCSESECPNVLQDMKENVAGVANGWAVTETMPKLAKVLLDGFPSQGIPPPRFVVAYNFGSGEVNNATEISYMKRALGQVEASATTHESPAKFVGFFKANNGVNYSNGDVYCTYKDWLTFTCMTGGSVKEIPDRPDLLTSLQNGSLCQASEACQSVSGTAPAPAPAPTAPEQVTPEPMAIAYQGVFTALGGVNYSNGSTYCYFKSWETFMCITGRTDVNGTPDKPEWLQILRNGGECMPEPRCQNL
jgi:hypothetical protein